MNSRFVAYYRVSTERQGRSGLGLEAQREAVRQFLNGGARALVAEFTEIESGKRDGRPELARALQHAKLTGAALVIAKLDRLSRNASFLLTLRDAGVRFIAADNPQANDLTVGILAVIAEDERKRISDRTKGALQAARARGQRLGNPNGTEPLRRANKGNQAALVAIKATADQHARDVLPVIDALRAEGFATAAGIARELNARGIRTPRGGQWQAISVQRALARAAGA